MATGAAYSFKGSESFLWMLTTARAPEVLTTFRPEIIETADRFYRVCARSRFDMPHNNEWCFESFCSQPYFRRWSNLKTLFQIWNHHLAGPPHLFESIESIWIWMSLRMTVRVPVQVPKEPREPYRMRRGNLENGFEAFAVINLEKSQNQPKQIHWHCFRKTQLNFRAPFSSFASFSLFIRVFSGASCWSEACHRGTPFVIDN